MRKLWLLRHAKSSWDDPALSDFDRPLNGRGRKAARAMGAHLAKAGIRPDLVLVSAALRTRATWDIVSTRLVGIEAAVEPRLYEAGRAELLERLHEVDDRHRSVMLVGHNPGMERLAQHLVGGRGDAHALGRLTEKFPTCALAEIDLPVPGWAEVTAECGSLAGFLRPADLEGD